MKPVGLVDPRTGQQPFAVVQLRAENLRFSSYNLVGFQNHLKFPEQERILRKIPGLEHAEFLRFGQIHRNTYVNAPRLLRADLSLRAAPNIFIAGQLCGVEGYVECIATGLLAGVALAQQAAGAVFTPPPRTTALGSLIHYTSHADLDDYQPANFSFDLLPPMENLPRVIARDRRARRARQCERAFGDLQEWLDVLCPKGANLEQPRVQHAETRQRTGSAPRGRTTVKPVGDRSQHGSCHSERSEESRSESFLGRPERDSSLRSE
jgi:methylenetetrahydrofolate--tRNA-(uracil-5-)-methyltransferase